jgi:site-specific recombinase XerD
MRFPVETLDVDECRRLLAACSNCSTGIRNRALIVILWRGGLRCAEALNLEERDIADAVVKIRNGKGGKARTVALDCEAAAIVSVWMERRARLGLTGRVFSSLKGTPLQSQYVRNLFKRLGRKAKISKRVHPHGLRHTFASGLADEKVDLRIVQRALGHSSLATTARYVDHLRPTLIIDTLKSRKW